MFVSREAHSYRNANISWQKRPERNYDKGFNPHRPLKYAKAPQIQSEILYLMYFKKTLNFIQQTYGVQVVGDRERLTFESFNRDQLHKAIEHAEAIAREVKVTLFPSGWNQSFDYTPYFKLQKSKRFEQLLQEHPTQLLLLVKQRFEDLQEQFNEFYSCWTSTSFELPHSYVLLYYPKSQPAVRGQIEDLLHKFLYSSSNDIEPRPPPRPFARNQVELTLQLLDFLNLATHFSSRLEKFQHSMEENVQITSNHSNEFKLIIPGPLKAMEEEFKSFLSTHSLAPFELPWQVKISSLQDYVNQELGPGSIEIYSLELIKYPASNLCKNYPHVNLMNGLQKYAQDKTQWVFISFPKSKQKEVQQLVRMFVQKSMPQFVSAVMPAVVPVVVPAVVPAVPPAVPPQLSIRKHKDYMAHATMGGFQIQFYNSPNDQLLNEEFDSADFAQYQQQHGKINNEIIPIFDNDKLVFEIGYVNHLNKQLEEQQVTSYLIKYMNSSFTLLIDAIKVDSNRLRQISDQMNCEIAIYRTNTSLRGVYETDFTLQPAGFALAIKVSNLLHSKKNIILEKIWAEIFPDKEFQILQQNQSKECVKILTKSQLEQFNCNFLVLKSAPFYLEDCFWVLLDESEKFQQKLKSFYDIDKLIVKQLIAQHKPKQILTKKYEIREFQLDQQAEAFHLQLRKYRLQMELNPDQYVMFDSEICQQFYVDIGASKQSLDIEYVKQTFLVQRCGPAQLSKSFVSFSTLDQIPKGHHIYGLQIQNSDDPQDFIFLGEIIIK